jgi:hypothetical protein
MDNHTNEELAARFEELAALEHEFEDVEEEISKLQQFRSYHIHRAFEHPVHGTTRSCKLCVVRA